MHSQCALKYLRTSMYFKVLLSTASTLKSTFKYCKYIKYIAWYLSVSTSIMVKFKRYLSTSTNVLGPMPGRQLFALTSLTECSRAE